MMKRQFFAVCVMPLLLFSMSAAFGDDNAVVVEVTGKNINLVSTLCGDDAPAADVNALKVKEMKDADGNAIEGYAGKILHYLPTEAAAGLMQGEANADKNVTVKGTLYKNAQAIAVVEFELQTAAESGDGGWDDWDDWDELGITTMSQQQVI